MHSHSYGLRQFLVISIFISSNPGGGGSMNTYSLYVLCKVRLTVVGLGFLRAELLPPQHLWDLTPNGQP